ncbi:MAG: hypothetical protein ABSG55_05335 [Dehalococcoidia bacterium]
MKIGANLQLPLVLDGDRLGVSSLDGNPPTEVTGPGVFDGVRFDSQGRLLFIRRTGPVTGFFRLEDGQPRLVIPFQRKDLWSPQAAWSPDGSKGAWLETSNGSTQLLVQDQGGKPRAWDLEACGNCYYLTWSPTGDKIAVSAVYTNTVSYVVDVTGSEPPLQLAGRAVLAWSSTGDLLLELPPPAGGNGGADTLFLAKPDGSNERVLGDMVQPSEGQLRAPAFSPDGRWIAWSLDVTGGGTSQALGLAATDGSGRITVTCPACGAAAGFDPAWSPDGKRLAWNQNGHIVIADVGVWQGRVLADGESPDWLLDGSEPFWSPDGSKIAYLRVITSSHSPWVESLNVKTADGSGPDVKVADLKDGWNLDRLVAWSPDGRSLVVPVQASPMSEMVSFDPVSGDLQRVPLADNETEYAVDPDGSRFLVNSGGEIVGMDGSRRNLDVSQAGSCFDWPKDGLPPLCVGPTGLKTMHFDTGEVKTLLSGDVAAAAWSPDGSRIALVSNLKLDVFDPATGAVTPIAPDLNTPSPNVYGLAGWPAWSPDSSRIAFTAYSSASPGSGSIYTVNADGSGLSGPLSGSQGLGFLSFSPDGKYLAATTSESAKVIDPQTGEEKISYGDRVYRAPIWVDSQTLLVSDDSSGIEAVGLDGSVQYLIGGTIPCYPGLVAWVGGKIFFSEICAIPGL